MAGPAWAAPRKSTSTIARIALFISSPNWLLALRKPVAYAGEAMAHYSVEPRLFEALTDGPPPKRSGSHVAIGETRARILAA